MNITCLQGKKFKVFSAGLVILGGILISLFNHWEPSGESWGYWFFAKIFAQTGKFIISDRSPLYTLYLNLFSWLGYPSSVIIEYVVTSAIVIFSLAALFRKYLGLGLAVFASLLWLPFLQVAEPPVQKLALACSCLAILARGGSGRNSFYQVVSYALLGLAYLFRCTYLLMIIIFVSWDVFKVIKYKGIRVLVSALRPRLIYWPVIIVILLFSFFHLNQSTHPWNNTYVTSAKWFPNRGKILSEASFLQNMNWIAIEDRYGTFGGKDYYFTNQEFFGGANTASGMVRANPKLIGRLLLINTKNLLPIALRLSDAFKIYLKLPLGYPAGLPGFLLSAALFAGILIGAFRAAKDESMALFMLANTALVCATILSLPKIRYDVPLIPVFILSAYWYGAKLRYKIISWSGSFVSKVKQRLSLSLTIFCLPLAVIFFSNGLSYWLHIIAGLAGDLTRREVKVLEAPGCMKGSFSQINELTKNCEGMMALESTFIGAFTGIPADRIYDVWEIPPFGQLDNSVYNGLTPERINCLFISSELKTGVGFASNYQIRYQNFIRPYKEKLQGL
ncbi:MAG: hypothetical protein WC417_07515, partial [Candidatus Omnitrophota bacterium]